MPDSCFHPSIEGAQHGAKSLTEFLDYAKAAGATGAQPSNYMLQEGKKFKTTAEIKDAFASREMTLDGISSHCPFWVHTTAWTESPTIRPFLPPEVAKKFDSRNREVVRRLSAAVDGPRDRVGGENRSDVLGSCPGLGIGHGVSVGFWKGGDYDLWPRARSDLSKKTGKLRRHAKELGIYLAHEIHPGTAAMCADDFLMLVEVCTGDKCLTVNADPSHCWEGEDWETRFKKVGSRIYGCHVKNIVIRRGLPLRMMEPGWQKRAMQFVDIPSGDLNMTRYVELLIHTGYPQRYCSLMARKTAPLIVEAESAYRDLDATSANGVAFVRDTLCFPIAAGSFEEGMGA